MGASSPTRTIRSGPGSSFAKANYPRDYDFVINVPVGRYLNDKTIGEAIAADLKKIGIQASVKPHEWANYVTATTAQKLFPMQLQGWGPATLDADDLYSTNLHSKSPFSHFQDERLDRLVEEGRSTLDKDKRLRIYREIAQYHHARKPRTVGSRSTSMG